MSTLTFGVITGKEQADELKRHIKLVRCLYETLSEQFGMALPEMLVVSREEGNNVITDFVLKVR